MPANKNALLRYKTIDACLQNRARRWTLEDLIDACSDALYEYTGKDEYISRRTVQLDIQKMRSDELGYNAPIEVIDKKYYIYSEPGFSITNTPLSQQDMALMSDAVNVLKQLSGFSALSGMEDIVGRLEDHVNVVRHEKDAVIYFEKNDNLVGLHYITPIYECITEKCPMRMSYQSFKARAPHDFIFSPYVLKEFRNRWFVFGRRQGQNALMNLALDRIIEISKAPNEKFIEDPSFDPKTFFDDMIGVTKGSGDRPQKITLLVSPEQVPYIMTKPLHKSQKILRRNDDGSVIFQIEVVVNYELERELISFSDGVKILSPRLLVKHVSERLERAASQYVKEEQPAEPAE